MRDIKDFQARYDRWKNGERYWDIRGVNLPQYDTGDKNTDQEYIFQRSNGTYYSSPTNSNAFTEDVTPVLKRDLSNPATWDFVGSDTNKKYTTQYTDDQLRQMAQNSMPNAEMIPWIDRAGNKQRSARVIGLSPADPVTSLAVEYAMGLPGWKALDYAGNKLAIDFARDFAFTKLGNWTRNKILSNQLNKNIKNWDGTVGTEYFNSPNYWYRWSETPEVEGIREMGKNVTTRDAINTINVPSNNWRMAAMENYSKSKNGYWYKAIKPDEDMSLRERAKWIRTSKDKPIGYGKKVTSSNGNRSQGSYGRPWNGSLSTSGIGQLGLLEGNIGTHIPYSKFDRSVFALTPIEEVPIGGRIGFKTGEMPMNNLGWFTKLPNGRFKYNGEVLPYKRIEMLKKQGNGRYQFDSPTYQMYTGPKHDISEIINADGSVNLRTLLNVQNEALQNVPGGTIARHRLENAKWHPTDWNTFLHTRDAYKRALDNNYPQEALFPTLMHDFGKMWSGDGHGPYGASIIRQIFPKASNEQIQAIYGHMDANPVAPLTRLVKGVDIKEPNKFRYLQKPLNHHLQGEDALKMFKEYGGTPIPEGSINGDQLRKYVMEARERYGLIGNTNISDEEIAQALYKHVNELGKGSAAINSQGEPQLLFRGDTKPYTKLKVNHDQIGKSGTEDNVLGTMFLDRTGIGEGWGPDRYMYLANQDNNVMAPYRNGIETESFTTLQPKFKPDYVVPFEEKGFVDDFDISYPYYKHDGKYGAISGGKISSEAFADGYTNQLNGFVVRTPHERDITNEVLTNGMSRPPKVGEEFQWRVPHTTDISSAPRETRILQNKAVVKDAQQKNQGLLRSKAGSPYRDEHDKYDYLVVPDFNTINVKHILPYDLRIPRNWSDPNIFRIAAPIGISLPFSNNFYNK